MIDALRAMSRARWDGCAGTAVPVFNEIFLDAVRERGRIFELGLMIRFKLRTRRLFEDAGKAPMMLLKGKLPLSGARVGGKDERKALFGRAAAEARPTPSDLRIFSRLLARWRGQGLPPLHAGRGRQAGPGTARAEGLDLLRLDRRSLERPAAGRRPAGQEPLGRRRQPRSRWPAPPATAGSRRPTTISPETPPCAPGWRTWSGRDYDGRTPVLHLLEILCRDIGLRARRRGHQPPAGRAEGGLLLRLPAGASAGDHQFRRCREPHADGPAHRSRRGRRRSIGRTRPSAAERASPSPIRASCSNWATRFWPWRRRPGPIASPPPAPCAN